MLHHPRNHDDQQHDEEDQQDPQLGRTVAAPSDARDSFSRPTKDRSTVRPVCLRPVAHVAATVGPSGGSVGRFSTNGQMGRLSVVFPTMTGYSFSSRSRMTRDCSRLTCSFWPFDNRATCVPPGIMFTFTMQSILASVPRPRRTNCPGSSRISRSFRRYVISCCSFFRVVMCRS